MNIIYPGALLLLVAAIFINLILIMAATPEVYPAETVPTVETALILGAAVWTWGELRPSHLLADRLETGLNLYRSGKVRQLVLSGAVDGRGIDETLVMQKYLLNAGVPASVIHLDNRGTRTINSSRNLGRDLPGQEVIVVTNRFHLPRALFLCRTAGLVPHGVSSDLRPYQQISYFRFREFFARLRAVIDVLGKK